VPRPRCGAAVGAHPRVRHGAPMPWNIGGRAVSGLEMATLHQVVYPGQMPGTSDQQEEQARQMSRIGDLCSRIDQCVLPLCNQRVFESQRADFAEVLHLFIRVVLWLSTLSKLSFGEDYQAFAAGARAIFETAVDLVLLERDATGEASERMRAFELRQKWKQAQRALKHAAKGDLMAIPEGLRALYQTYVDEKATLVAADEARFWPKGVQRWTGRNLAQDADAVDGPGRWRRFTDFYANSYAQVCWNLHGTNSLRNRSDSRGAVFRSRRCADPDAVGASKGNTRCGRHRRRRGTLAVALLVVGAHRVVAVARTMALEPLPH
jgi:hypothetical protein